jgi:DNA-binding NarL/FixJ family response regulator
VRCLETRKRPGYTRRRYEREDGTRVTSYEFLDDHPGLTATLRKAIGLIEARIRSNAVLEQHQERFQPTSDPDRIDAVLDDLEAGKPQREIAAAHRISSKTIQRIKRGGA